MNARLDLYLVLLYNSACINIFIHRSRRRDYNENTMYVRRGVKIDSVSRSRPSFSRSYFCMQYDRLSQQ